MHPDSVRSYTDAVAELRSHAAVSHAPYPQYDGKFDHWILGLMQADWIGSGMSELHKGDIVLYNPIPTQLDGAMRYDVYCVETTGVCCVAEREVTPVAISYDTRSAS